MTTTTAAPTGTLYGPRTVSTWAPSSIALVAGTGLGLGIATQVLQGVLPDALGRLANSCAVWVVFAFIVGSFVPRGVRNTAAAGAATLAGALAGYYAAALIEGTPVAISTVLVWTGTALVGGPLFGIAGGWLRDEASWLVGEVPWRRIAALALLGGAVAAEGIEGVFIHPAGNPGSVDLVAWAMLFAGPLVPLLAGRTVRERLLGITAATVVVLAGLAAFGALNATLSFAGQA